MTREQRIQEVVEKITAFIGLDGYGYRKLEAEPLATFLVDEVLPKESDNDYRLPDPHLDLLDLKKTNKPIKE